jgi:proliferating cell nuclear antigen
MDFKITDESKIETFTTIFQTIKGIADYIVIYFTDEKMFIQTMDPSKVSVLEVSIRSSWFDFYSCQYENVKIGINTNVLYKILSSRERSQTIHFEYNMEDGNEDKLLVNMLSAAAPAPAEEATPKNDDPKPAKNNKNVYDRYFEVPLVNLDNDIMEIPNIDYEAEISLPSMNFAILIHQLKGFGDVLNIQCNENDIQFISKSLENGSMRVEIKIEELTGFSIIEGENINVLFGLQYLNTISSYSKIAKIVELKIRRNYPIRIDYMFGREGQGEGGEGGEGSVRYFLSPKLGDGNDV